MAFKGGVQRVEMVYSTTDEIVPTPNPQMMKYGGIAAGVGLLLAMISVTQGFGIVVLCVGVVIFWMGWAKKTRFTPQPCPHCRMTIAGRASVCPACHLETGFVPKPAI